MRHRNHTSVTPARCLAACLPAVAATVIGMTSAPTAAADGVYWIVADSPATWTAPDGRTIRGNLRVSVNPRDQATLDVPSDTNRYQQWRMIRVDLGKPAGSVDRESGFQFRNVLIDQCLTVARPEHSLVYLSNCAPDIGHTWFVWPSWPLRGPTGNILSENYNHSPFVGSTLRNTNCLDITNFRNMRSTVLQRGRCHNMWNQQWRLVRVPGT
jgi:hypothetical protein